MFSKQGYYDQKGNTSHWRRPRNKYRNVYGIVWIFSSDSTRSIYNVYEFQNQESTSLMLFFLEKYGLSRWRRVHSISVSIF
ncbi:hypothetical protein BWI93_05125 [Siphonobacter sp. BAB-5385]|nr:hypothetical protein BWI93_05125 [Siphonobacter sp. BAB-5385]PMD92523.1 hypothetical protein BWI97_20795 [Siphonobacter sp. BAB-5405]